LPFFDLVNSISKRAQGTKYAWLEIVLKNLAPMKIKLEQLKELLYHIDYYLAGIKKTCRMGGDVLLNIEDRADELRKLLVQLRASSLVTPADNILPDKKIAYLSVIEQLMNEPPQSHFSLSIRESTALWQPKLYHWSKRTIRERNTVPGADATEHDLFCYVDAMASKMNFRKNVNFQTIITINTRIRLGQCLPYCLNGKL
jgi:hypothetical protein